MKRKPKEQFSLEDHPILRIGWLVHESHMEFIEVGTAGVTMIDCQEQYLGEYSIYWLQVWKKEKLVARYNARNVDTIEYNYA